MSNKNSCDTNNFNRNIKILSFIFALKNTPAYFFLKIYFLFVTKSYFLVMLVNSLETLSQTILEIPTGIMSDKYLGRKLSEVIGSLSYVISFTLYALSIYHVSLLFIGAFFNGLASSLHSGNTDALLYDTLRAKNKEKEYHHYYAKFHKYQNISLSISLLICGLLMQFFGVIYIVYFCILQRSLRTILSCFLKNTCIREKNKISISTSVKHFISAYKKIANNRNLQLLSLISVLRSMFVVNKDLTTIFYKHFLSFFSMGGLFAVSLFARGIVA